MERILDLSSTALALLPHLALPERAPTLGLCAASDLLRRP